VTATDPRTTAIGAGARASYERYRADRPDLGLRPWDEAGPNMRRSELAESETHYNAMVPLIRAAVAEEIAQAIEAKHVSARLHKTCIPCEVGSAAAAIAREIGAVPVSVVPADSAGGQS